MSGGDNCYRENSSKGEREGQGKLFPCVRWSGNITVTLGRGWREGWEEADIGMKHNLGQGNSNLQRFWGGRLHSLLKNQQGDQGSWVG